MSRTQQQERRTRNIIETLDGAFAPLMAADPGSVPCEVPEDGPGPARVSYAARVSEDHALFVDGFREARIGISAT
ncbi:MAG: hypothetical protein J2P22_16120 [Nocardioides sp.]|nr:hypothetical protein [Nocardioides sp.]